MGFYNKDERISLYKSNLKTYDTFSEASGLLFYNIPREGVNPFHGYSTIDREKGIFDQTKRHGNYIVHPGEQVQGKYYGVPLKSDITSKTFTSLRTQWEDKANITVNDFWLSWRKHKHDGPLLDSISKKNKVEESFEKKLPKSQRRVLLLTMVIMELVGGIILSMLSPFFPLVAEEKGVSTTVTGVVMATCEIVMVLLSPIYGNYIYKTGTRFTYVSGSIVAGTCAILFAFTIHAPDRVFVPLCVTILVVQGAGTAAYCTTTYSILVHTFPQDVASVFGALETAQGAGLMAGPFLGSILYEIGGYELPFFVMGSFTVLVSIGTTFIVPSIAVKKTLSHGGTFSMLRLVLKPVMLLCGILHFSSAFVFGILDVTLALRLQTFNAGQIVIGSMFISVFIGYVICAPLWGRVVDKWPQVSYVILYGGFTLSVAMLFLAGPAPFIPFLPSDNLLVLFLSFIFMGAALSSCVVTFSLIIACAKSSGLPDDISTYGKVSGFTESCYCFGSCMGPLLGGVMYEHIGWEWTITSPAFIMIAALLILFLYLMKQKFTAGFNFLDNPHEHLKTLRKDTKDNKTFSTYKQLINSTAELDPKETSVDVLPAPNGHCNEGAEQEIRKQMSKTTYQETNKSNHCDSDFNDNVMFHLSQESGDENELFTNTL